MGEVRDVSDQTELTNYKLRPSQLYTYWRNKKIVSMLHHTREGVTHFLFYERFKNSKVIQSLKYVPYLFEAFFLKYVFIFVKIIQRK